MANVDLSSYDFSELKGLQHDIERMLKVRQQEEMRTAREKVLEIARGAGVSVEELLSVDHKKSKEGGAGKVKARYKNPDDSSQTWTGRGRQPKWVANGLANGKTLADFAI